MLLPTIVTSQGELQQILALQQSNLSRNINKEEMQSQGFVTMEHSLEILQQMHDLAPSIIVKDDNKVAGYALMMPRECRALVPPLESMFANFDVLHWKNKPLNDYRFYVMGQICVDKAYRGMGISDMLYQHHKKIYSDRFDFMLTEVATRNHRSLRAHERVGFLTINQYRDVLDEWAVILWDWK